MITSRYSTVETELVHWLVLLVAAIAMLLVLATALAADPTRPLALPGNLDLPAGPIARPFFPEQPPLTEHASAQAAERLWTTLSQQRAGCYAEALAGWEEIRLPQEELVWKEVGMAAALLALDDLPQALRRLEHAENMAPHHPLVSYFRGLVWSRQVERIDDREANAEDSTVRAAATAVLEDMAIADFEEAVELADLIDSRETLVEGQGPQVHDVLAAISAMRFVADAHGHLFKLHLRRGEPAQRHLELAVMGGVVGSGDLRQMADALIEKGRQADALRLMHEAVRLDNPELEQVCRTLHNWLVERRPATWVW